MVFLLMTCLVLWAEHEPNLGSKTLVLLGLFLRTMRKTLKSIGLYSLSRFQERFTFGTSRKRISNCANIKQTLSYFEIHAD